MNNCVLTNTIYAFLFPSVAFLIVFVAACSIYLHTLGKYTIFYMYKDLGVLFKDLLTSTNVIDHWSMEGDTPDPCSVL